MNVRNRLFEAFDNVGIVLDENNTQEKLSDIIVDSLVYVSLIVEVEEKFGIEIPTEYLNIDNLSTLNSFVYVIEKLMEEQMTE